MMLVHGEQRDVRAPRSPKGVGSVVVDEAGRGRVGQRVDQFSQAAAEVAESMSSPKKVEGFIRSMSDNQKEIADGKKEEFVGVGDEDSTRERVAENMAVDASLMLQVASLETDLSSSRAEASRLRQQVDRLVEEAERRSAQDREEDRSDEDDESKQLRDAMLQLDGARRQLQVMRQERDDALLHLREAECLREAAHSEMQVMRQELDDALRQLRESEAARDHALKDRQDMQVMGIGAISTQEVEGGDIVDEFSREISRVRGGMRQVRQEGGVGVNDLGGGPGGGGASAGAGGVEDEMRDARKR